MVQVNEKKLEAVADFMTNLEVNGNYLCGQFLEFLDGSFNAPKCVDDEAFCMKDCPVASVKAFIKWIEESNSKLHVGLKMPTLEDYRFPISETEEDQMIDYAYDLRDYAESLEKYIDRIQSKNSENLEYVKEEIKEAFYLSEKATDLRNQFYKVWFSNCTPTGEEERQMISIINDQLLTLWKLNSVLSRLLSDLEDTKRGEW